MKKSLIEKNFKLLIVICITITIIAILSVIFVKQIFSNISDDSMVSYIGTIITGIVSILCSFLSLYENKKKTEAEEEISKLKYRDSIRPALSVKLNKIEDDLFKIIIENISSNYAKNIYLYQYPILSDVKNSCIEQKLIVFSDRTVPNAVSIDDDNYYTMENGYPKRLHLIFNDIDNNQISQEFMLTPNNEYEALPVEYDNELQ